MQDVDVSTVENSQKKGKDESAPIVAKKLDFESHDEFPSESDQISPSIIDNTKMRRRNSGEESTSTGKNRFYLCAVFILNIVNREYISIIVTYIHMFTIHSSRRGSK